MPFHNGQGGMQKYPEQQICELAHTASGCCSELAVDNYKTVFIRCFSICIPRCSAEGKRIAGTNQHIINCYGSKFQVEYLVFLINQIKSRVSVIHRANRFIYKNRQPISALGGAVFMSIQSHTQIKTKFTLFGAERNQPWKNLCNSFSFHLFLLSGAKKKNTPFRY